MGEYNKEYYKQHREKILSTSAKWKKDNPSKCKSHIIAYWNRKVGISNSEELSPEALELKRAYNRNRYKEKADKINAERRKKRAEWNRLYAEYLGTRGVGSFAEFKRTKEQITKKEI